MVLDNVMLAAAGDAGGYISVLKILPVVVILFVWAKLLAWVDKDAHAAHLPREGLNSGFFALGLLAFVGFFLVPNFFIALGVLLAVLLGCAGVYLTLRNQKVGLKDLRGEIQKSFSAMKPKKKTDAKAGQVVLLQKAGPMPVPDAEDPMRIGYDNVQIFLTEPLQKNAERIEVRPADAQNAAVSYYVDGVPYSSPPLPLNEASAGIAYMKIAANMDVDDRRKPQNAAMKIMMDEKKRDIEVATAGTTAGETMKIVIDPKGKHAFKLDKLGFTPAQLEVIQATIKERNGIVLVAAPKQHGLSSTLYTLMRAHDAFLNHIQTVERAPKEDLEGITQNKLSAAPAAAEEYKMVDWVTSQLPDTLMIDEVASPESAKALCKFIQEGTEATRSVYVGVRAGSAFDAITQWMRLVGDDQLAAATLKMAVSQRVARRLCLACKVAYAPDPDTMRKLNMDPAKTETLYQARTQPLADSKGNPIPCEFCHDLRYKGRFAVYEILTVDDEMRKVIAAGANANQMKNVFRKQKGKYLQEMALAQVQAGETSVQEVLRVLKADAPASPATPATAAPAPRAARQPAR